MKKSIILLAVVSASFVSCSKTEESRPEVKSGIPMSVSASFSDLTKTSTVADGNALKSTWDAEESISIITLDASKNGKVVAIDNFTSDGVAGRSSASFSGTFTGGANPVKVIAVYPALEKDGNIYRTKSYPFSRPGGTEVSVLDDIQIGKATLSTASVERSPYQTGGCSHLKNYCVLVGNADISNIKNGMLSVSLRNLMSVIKIRAIFPLSYTGREISEMTLKNTGRYMFVCKSSAHVDLDSSPFLGDAGYLLKQEINVRMDIKIPRSGYVDVYIPFVPYDRDPEGRRFGLTAKIGSREYSSSYRTKRDVTYEAGKMYRMDVHLGR